MDYDYHEAMKLANQLCFPLYAAARNVTGLYTPWLTDLHPVHCFPGALGKRRSVSDRDR